MNGPAPVVRHWIPCSDILYSKEFPRRVTLVHVLSSIEPKDVPAYPYHCHQLCLFAQLSEGRGTGEIQVVIRRSDDDIIVYDGPIWSVTFSDDPLDVVGIPMRIHDVVFSEPGLYSIELMYDSQLIADKPLLCR